MKGRREKMYNEAVMNKRRKFKIYWQFSGCGIRNEIFLCVRPANDDDLARGVKWKENVTGGYNPSKP